MTKRIDAARDGEQRADQHQQEVARRPGDEAGDHCASPALVRPCSAALRLLSASIRKLAATTTLSPPSTPSRDFDIAVAPRRPSLDVARLEAAFALVDEHDLARRRCR